MLLGAEELPLALHVVIGLHLYLALSSKEPVLLIPRDEMGKHGGVGSLDTIFG